MVIAERMVVSATVKSRAEEKEGFRLELEVPQFRSKYPVKVSRVPKAVADLLPPRDVPYTVVLLRENLQKDKSGDLPWHYYWGLEGPASAEEAAAKAAEPAPGPDEREHRIMRSTALAQAVAYSAEHRRIGTGDGTVTQILDIAATFYAWLRDGPQDAQDRPPAARGIPSKDVVYTQGAQHGRDKASTGDGSKLVTAEEIKAYAMAEPPDGLGYADVRAMAAVPGVTAAMRAVDYVLALELLKKNAPRIAPELPLFP